MPLFSVRVAAQSTVIATASMILFHGFTVAFSSVGRIYTQSLFSQIPLRSTTTRARFSNVIIPVPVQSIFYPSVNSVIRESFSRRNLFSSKQHEDKDATSSRSTTAVSHKFSVPAMEVETTTTDGIQYNDYERWVRRLYATNMFHPVKLGLENMRLLHKLLGNPMDDVSNTCRIEWYYFVFDTFHLMIGFVDIYFCVRKLLLLFFFFSYSRSSSRTVLLFTLLELMGRAACVLRLQMPFVIKNENRQLPTQKRNKRIFAVVK